MNYLRQLLGAVRQFLRPVFMHLRNSVPVLFVLCLILIFIGIWTYGTSWSFSGLSNEKGWDFEIAKNINLGSRILATVIVLLALAAIAILKLQLKNLKLNKEKNNLEKSQEEQDEVLHYIKDQEESLNLMATALKEHISDKNYIYQLPWYMVLGFNGAGKTSFINRSNQKFTLTAVERTSKHYLRKDSLYQVDWWASDEAILIDPDGAMVSQFTDKEAEDKIGEITKGLWHHLLGWINKVRPRRPLNGIVLVLELSKLIGSKHSDRKALATILRNRVREITEQFGARIPVYVVLNKADLIEGFDVFYDDLKQSERYENLGFSFTLNSEDHIDDWTKEFADGYDSFIKEIEETVFDRLATTISRDDREAMYMYVRQLAGAKEILQQFIGDVLESDRFTTTPYVRGIYFSSIFQQGLPADFYQDALSKYFELKYAVPSYTREKSQRTYFTHNFFKNIIYPEAGLVSDNARESRSNRRKFILTMAGLSVVSVCLLAVWQNYFYQNKVTSEKVVKLTEEFTQMNISQAMDPTGRNLLKPLNLLRQATFAYGDYNNALPVIEDFGLYQGKKVGGKVSEAYQKFLGERFLPEIASGLIEQMDVLPENSDEGLELLRVYRMIDDMKNRKAKIPEQWMAQYLQKNYPNNADIQRQLMGHFTYAMQYVDPDLSMFDKTIAQKQQEYSRLPLADRVYQSFKILANTELQPATDLKQVIGDKFSTIFKTTQDDSDDPLFFKDKKISSHGTLISPLFTDWAYKDFYVPKADDILQLAAIDAWVLGKQQTTNYTKAELDKLSGEIRERYVSDYIDTWQEALNGLEMVHFADLKHAVEVLDALNGKDKPLEKMVNIVDKNSDIYPSLSKVALEEGNNAAKINANQLGALEITQSFSGLTNVAKANGNAPAYMDSIMKKLGELKFYLQTIQNSPSPSQSALKAIVAEFNLERTNPTVDLKRLANDVAEPLATQLNHIADEAWNVELRTALAEINTLWKKNVYSFYTARIAGKYPLDRKATQSMSLEDFQAFFGPQGRIQKFYDEYLKFILDDNAELSVVSGESVISPAFLTALQQLQEIQHTFFNVSGNLSVEFSLKPLGMSGKFASSTLNIDGQILKYNHERPAASRLLWPNTLRKDVETSLTLIDTRGEAAVLRRTGAWSLFKLLDAAQNRRNGQTTDLSFKLGGGSINYRLQAENGMNPFSGNVLSGFSLPSRLLDTQTEEKQENEAEWEEVILEE
ncbi:type VI secretion system protein ImpL [Cricetibacter osteomyelitidis]|uniref:Type VI secretion system protein ImpL n=1 Tax=Cricetibacter osteomyelitidis TaxID=1521931 RepID=A0A4R2SPL7_9PAST|nr:type VI secretion system membrane subunit TssM [Cricetibacter osteomyelitidis]TCP91180.1 type VI secretion system protein ImpL [Cricetibacter osteomyelitidis]